MDDNCVRFLPALYIPDAPWTTQGSGRGRKVAFA